MATGARGLGLGLEAAQARRRERADRDEAGLPEELPARIAARAHDLHQPLLLEQGVHIGRAAAELHEGVERLARAALRQDGVEETLRRGAIEHAFLGERRERVGGENFGPLVAVVTGRVAAREDVREVERHAVPGGYLERGDFL